jgi:hypothetical protein
MFFYQERSICGSSNCPLTPPIPFQYGCLAGIHQLSVLVPEIEGGNPASIKSALFAAPQIVR